MSNLNPISQKHVYRYKTLSIKHFKELQEDIDRLRRENKLSNHETYQKYINNKKFELPKDFPIAKSIIIIAFFTEMMVTNFHYNGKKFEVIIPPQYYSSEISDELMSEIIINKIIGDPNYKIEKATGVHLKLLAARSGLGNYGRNNLCYVEGMGSLITLMAYFTDYQFPDENWTEIKMMEKCEECKICLNQCPNKCLSIDNFVIDAGKCLSLYNEVHGIFPEWIKQEAHNALIGCMACQLNCPANQKVLKLTGKLEDVTEEETRKILNNTPDKELLESLSSKLREFYPAASDEYFPIFVRNLSVLLKR